MSNKPSVLVVEDEFILAMTLEAHLNDLDFEVQLAPTAEAGMAALDSVGKDYTCLITDIRLGPGATGWDLACWARERNALMPIIYMSGDSILDWNHWGVSKSLMLAKPFSLNQLTTALLHLTDKARFELPISR